MKAFIDDHCGLYGVEPICKVLPIAPSTYREHAARRADPGRAPARDRRDCGLRDDIRRIFAVNFEVYAVRKIWHQMKREAIDVARCAPVAQVKVQTFHCNAVLTVLLLHVCKEAIA